MSKKNKKAAPQAVPKITGFDVELAALDPRRNDRGVSLCRQLLARIPGVPAGYRSNWAQDSGRKFLPENGGCVYIDMDHLEICGGEVRSAWDIAKTFHAMLDLPRQAAREINANREEHELAKVYANNSDGHSRSWGGHQSFLLSRRGYERLTKTRLHTLLGQASVQISSLIFTGAGKIGSENGAPHCGFQISQRADFFEQVGPSTHTTMSRPLVNSRDESLAADDKFARLHSIFFDTVLCHPAIVMRTGFMQLMLAMLEQDVVDPSLTFEDPLLAVRVISHDPSLQARVQILSGQRVTALEHQWMVFENATRFVDQGKAEGIVPRATEILDLWGATLEEFSSQKWDALARKIDWVAKKALLERAGTPGGLEQPSPELKVLDHAWSEIDGGLFRALEADGAVDQLVSPAEIECAGTEPPSDTRAFARALLLREFADDITAIDWHGVVLRRFGERLRVLLPDPAAGTRDDLREAESLHGDDLLAALGAHTAPAPSYYRTSAHSSSNETTKEDTP